MTTADLLDAIDTLLQRFVALPTDHDRHAIAAWVLHAWTLDAFDSTPRLALLSPEKGSGKTRTLEVLELLVPSPKHTVNMSASVLFRLVGLDKPVTLLMDEADTYLGWKVAAQHEDIRGLVNAGHRRGATTYRMNMEGGAKVEEFPAYSAVALAGIGDLPDTIIDRSIVVAMKRRSPTEHVAPFRRRKVEPTTSHLLDAIEQWSADHLDELSEIVDDLELPAGIEDRAADVWEPLVAIGDLAGGEWQTRIRAAATAINNARADRDPSLGVQMLRDIRRIFGQATDDRISSAALADQLGAIEGSPWADIKGEPIDANKIARRLRPYEIRPTVHRFGDITSRGYIRSDFYDAWQRYLPPSGEPVTDVTDVTEPPTDGPVIYEPTLPVTGVTGVTASPGGVSLPAFVDCPECGELSVRPGEICQPCADSSGPARASDINGRGLGEPILRIQLTNPDSAR